jgi:dienelactone hydrolase
MFRLNLIFRRGNGKYPAVVIVHALGGYQEANEGWFAAEFRKAGFASLTYDSFAARKIVPSRAGGAQLGDFAAGVADAYAALRSLAANPRIEADHVAIVGFSFGGEVAHLAALESLRRSLAGELSFATFVSFYPAGVYAPRVEAGAYTGRPVLMLLGDRDDNLPLDKVNGFLRYEQALDASFPVQVRVYEGDQHAWTVASLGPARFYPQYGSTKRCPYILLGRSGPGLLVDGKEAPFNPGVIDACLKMGQGYTMGYDADLRRQSADDAIAFLRQVLRK